LFIAPALARVDDEAAVSNRPAVTVAPDPATVGVALTCPSCFSANRCVIDSCDSTTGTCRHDPRSCDDGNPCTQDQCSEMAGCWHIPLPDATPCDDGKTCTLGDSCSAGVCVPHELVDANTPCDDGNSCTVSDMCDSSHRCAGTWLGIGTDCDDGNACTRDDQCVAGEDAGTVCRGTGPECSDGDYCTEDRCDPATGQCLHPPVSCVDGNPCTSDACDPAIGCRRDHLEGPCEDGQYCSVGDTCSGGNCVAQGGRVCPDSGCAVGFCDEDYDACMRRDTGPCPSGECYFSRCENGVCRYENLSGPTYPCTGPPSDSCGIYHCVAGLCRLNGQVPCDDGNPCTEDVCSGRACAPVPKADGALCAANLCSTGACQSGVCTGATPVSCDDGNACTLDSCDPASGCKHVSGACDDGNPCTRDSCSPATGTCVSEPVSCEDGNPCTWDECDSGLGGCVHHAGGCNDGNSCTTDSCTSTGGCQYVPQAAGVPCDDGNGCTRNDTCLVSPGVGMVCAGDGPSCDDGNPCTTDVGVAEGNLCVCDHLPVENACCSAGAPISCDDGNPCTADRCEPGIGCTHGGTGTLNPPPETCNGLDDDCDGQVDERELYPMCAVRPLIMRDSGTLKTFTVTCRWKPACPGAPVPAPRDEIREVWLSAADLLLDTGDNAPLPNPLAHCDSAIVEDPAKRMTGDAAVTFVFDEDGDGVCGTSDGGRPGLMQHLAGVPDGKLARVCIRGQGAGAEHCSIVLVRHDTATEPQPVNPGEEERRILLPAP